MGVNFLNKKIYQGIKLLARDVNTSEYPQNNIAVVSLYSMWQVTIMLFS